MKAVVLTNDQWKEVHEKIKKDYPPSVWLSREKMRRTLGFTPREHESWLGYYDSASIEDRKASRHGRQISIHLDFFTDSQRTMFLLKYGDKFGNNVENS
jgi:hypothetical protein